MDYFVTEKIEVLVEVAASIYAEILRYMMENGIDDDEKHPLYILRMQVFGIRNTMLSSTEYTMEDMGKFAAKLEFAREFIDEVIKANEA